MLNETYAITGTEALLDSRDIEVRIQYLQDLGMVLTEEELEEKYQDKEEELTELLHIKYAFIDEYSRGEELWEEGIVFINDGYFVEDTINYLEEIGVVDSNFYLLRGNIDWEGVARDRQLEYETIVMFDQLFWVTVV